MIFFEKTRTIGQDANGKNVVLVSLCVDTAADLPAYNAYESDGYVLSMSSKAHTIDTDKKYELTSAGTWVEQSQPWQPLADYSVLSNKPQINGHTLTGNQTGTDLGLQNVLTFDSIPTENSTNPVTSDGIWTALQSKVTIDDVYGLGVSIPSNSDIDEYKNVGVYYVQTAAVAALIPNLPVPTAGRLEVKALNTLNRYIQVYFSADSVYQRRWNGTSWSPWYQYTLTAI